MSNTSAVVEAPGGTSHATYPATSTTYYHGDHPGSTRLATTAAGWPVSAETYYPFGLEQAVPADANHYKFTGYERDAESTLDHATFRQLSFTQGRWTAPDPYDGSYSWANPQTFNRYSYALNNPLTYVDPSGLWTGQVYQCGVEQDGTPIYCLQAGTDPGGDQGPPSCTPIINAQGQYEGCTPNGPTAGQPNPGDPGQNGGEAGSAPSNAPPPINWKKVGSCLVDSTLKHYGLDALTAGSGALAIPISKSLVPPFRMIGEPTTNLLSVLGHYVEINVPRITIDGLASTNLLRIAGRANPYVAGALLAIDVGMISYDTYQCYQKP